MSESPEVQSSLVMPSQKKSDSSSYPSEISSLPITPYLENICAALKKSTSHFMVLTAETAAGKSTAVPLALLKHFNHKIVMLEPRRLAAVAIANRVAHLLGEETGQTSGYRLHLESKISSSTRFEVMTEAILTRRLQNDPSLEGTDVVVIDEFHERSVHADLALAFLKESMQLRDNLYVIVMSATIDTEQLSAYLACPVLHVSGRQFPVSIDYRPSVSVAQAVKEVISTQIAQYRSNTKASVNNHSLANDRSDFCKNGSILVFLPGIYDINRAKSDIAEVLQQTSGSHDDTQKNGIPYDGYIIQLLVLHSSIPFSEQKEVLQPLVQEHSVIRIILSSSIAETSLTVPGVTTVIDSGLARISRFDASTGMEKLATESESVFSAEQRAGRAGRTAPGTCIRLWAQNDVRVTRTPPEIMRADLTPLVLECAQWGVASPEKLSWLDTPPHSSWQNAHDLLAELGCITKEEHITQTGTDALLLGLHPRLACVALEGKKIGQEKHAAAVIIRFTEYADSSYERQKRFIDDVLNRLSRCYSVPIKKQTSDKPNAGVLLRASHTESDTHSLTNDSLILLAGFPDRLARYAGSNMQLSAQQNYHQTAAQTQSARYQFPSGKIAMLPKADSEKTNTYPQWIVAPEVDSGEQTGKIYSYEIISDDDAERWLCSRTNTTTKTVFADSKSFKLQKFEYTCYGKIILKETKIVPSASDFADAVCSAVQEYGIKWLPLTPAAESLLIRTEFYDNTAHDSQEICSADKINALSECPKEWLLPFLTGGSSNKIDGETVYNALYWYLDGQTIDRMVPVEITLPNGKKRRISYEKRTKQTNDSSITNGSTIIPVLEVVIQQIFGCFETPKILGVPVLLKLLSPARRPLQITDDLAGFWVNTWPEICKEMKGRYPKHNWDYRVAESNDQPI